MATRRGCTVVMGRAVSLGRMRRIICAGLLVVVALGLALGGNASGAAAETLAAANAAVTPVVAGPLTVEGDPVSAIVPVGPTAAEMYALGANHLYRTGDGGQTWQVAGPPPPAGVIVAAADDARLLLAGNQEQCARGGGGTPLNRSDDGGATWHEVQGVTGVRPLAIWRALGLALGVSCTGWQRSTDAGQTWQTASLTAANYDVTAFATVQTADPATPIVLFTGTSEGGTSRLWRADFSDPSNPIVSGPLREFWGIGALAATLDRYVVGEADGVWISDDQGRTWTRHRQGLEDVTISVNPFEAPIPSSEMKRGFGITVVALDPDRTGTLYAATVNGLYASRDAGAHWQRVPGISGKIVAVWLAPRSGRVFVQTARGVVIAPLR